MPVQVFPASHGANPVKGQFVDDVMDVLMSAWPDSKFHELLQSSFDNDALPSALIPSTNGLVYSLMTAYATHHHLLIRPEDIWFAVLTQLSLFINKNAEELRGKFVSHEGKKELRIDYNVGDRYSVDFGLFARQMTELLDKNITDPKLRDWIMPAFSTTTDEDRVVASILMMGCLKKYFDYTCGIICGFPSVTLLGEKEDYENILARLDKLAEYGAEPTQFAAVLKPVLGRFICAFDDPQAEDVINFWKRTIYVDDHICGITTYSGWITAFCFWDEDGKCLYNVPEETGESEYSDTGDFGDKYVEQQHGDRTIKIRQHGTLNLALDGVKYHKIDAEDIPPGWSMVPVKIDDSGNIIESEMVAGSVGISCSSSGVETTSGTVDLDTMQPQTGWWIYAKQQEEHPALAEARAKMVAKSLSEDTIEYLIAQARSSGQVPNDRYIDIMSPGYHERLRADLEARRPAKIDDSNTQ